VRHVGQFIDKVCEVTQAGEVDAEVDAHLDLKIGHDGDEVAVPHTLAVAVDRALHLAGAGTHSGQRIGDADAAVIVRVDAHRFAEMSDDLAGCLFDELRQCAPPFVSHSTMRSAPASCAALTVLSEYSGSSLKLSKKCSAS
jgi:hypothetical protein